MTDIMVSIRMPSSLLKKLKELVEKEHFLDVSEEIRSITRERWIQSLHPELHEIQRLRKDILTQIKDKSQKEVTKKVIDELASIKESIKKEDYLK